MKLSNLLKGVQILRPYYDDPDGYHNMVAKHNQFFMWATQRPLSDIDAAAMFELGWNQPEQESEGGYNPDDGWCCWV